MEFSYLNTCCQPITYLQVKNGKLYINGVEQDEPFTAEVGTVDTVMTHSYD